MNVTPASPMVDLVPAAVPIAVPTISELIDCSAHTGSPALTTSLNVTAPSVSPIRDVEALGASLPAKVKPITTKTQAGMNGGRWTEQEHQSFLAGLRLYGREWKKVASKIKTRTSAQIRSHAQKYFAKLARDDELRRHGGLLPHQDDAGASNVAVGGYFSDGGSSVAVNSGDEDGDTDAGTTQQRSLIPARVSSSSTALSTEPSLPGSSFSTMMPPTLLSTIYTTTAPIASKKRTRAVASSEVTSQQHFVKQRKLSPQEAGQVALLPSQEELLEKVSPNIRHRFSSLVDAEICALQVLSCYAMLQRQDQRQKQTKERRRKHHLTHGATRSVAPNSTMHLGMLTTEQIPSASSIY